MQISPMNNNIYKSLIHKLNKDIMLSNVSTAISYSSTQSAEKVASFVSSYGISNPINVGSKLSIYA